MSDKNHPDYQNKFFPGLDPDEPNAWLDEFNENENSEKTASQSELIIEIDEYFNEQVVDLTPQDTSDSHSNTLDLLTLEEAEELYKYGDEKKKFSKANPLINKTKRNSFDECIRILLLNSCVPEIRLFTDQLCYIAVSYSAANGILREVATEKNAHEIVRCCEQILLAALYGVPSVLARVAQLTRKSVVDFKFPTATMNYRKTLQEKYIKRTFSLDGRTASNDWFYYASAIKSSLKFTHKATELLERLFKQTAPGCKELEFDFDNLAAIFEGKLTLDFNSPSLEHFSSLNKCTDSALTRYKKIQALGNYCEDAIKGQRFAISTLEDMMKKIAFGSNGGVLGIATFMGAAGTGKTALAEAFANGLNEVFGLDYRLSVFNMEMFSDKRSGLKLFGSGSQYTDSSLGDLTTEVLVAPRQVIIFDEIEKAHDSVIQSLLTLLEKGEAYDQTSNILVDFSQCFIIFTTNLGQKAAEQALTEQRKIDIKSLLLSNNYQKGLSQELVSRLSRGHVALFRQLNPRDLIQVAESAIAKMSIDSNIRWPINHAELLIETLGGNLEPRSILSQVSVLQGKVLDVVCSNLHENSNEPDITVNIVEDIQDFEFAVIVADPNLQNHFKTRFPKSGIFQDLASFNHALSQAEYKVALIHAPLLRTEQRLTQQETIHYYCFGQPDDIANVDKTPEHIEKTYSVKDYSPAELQKLVELIAKRSRLLSSINEWRQRKMDASFEYQYSLGAEGVVVTLCNPKYEQRFSPEDFAPVFMKEPCIPELTFKDLLGLDALKKQMSLILKCLKNEHDFALDMPKGYLFAGQPGTGKSYFAKAVAGECGVPFLSINAADLMLGDVIANINHLFDVAERYAPCIVFFDEFDAIAKSRDNATTIGHLAVNTLLTRLDGFQKAKYPVFVLAATNSPQSLDNAIVRFGRFDKIVQIPLPDFEARRSYIRSCAERYQFPLSDSFVDEFSKKCSGATFGFLNNVFREIQLLLLADDVEFSPKMLDDKLLTTMIGAKKLNSSKSAHTRLITAYHETGHYLLTKKWYPDAPCNALSIEEHEFAGGVTSFDLSNLDQLVTRGVFQGRLETLLAGRAAEQILDQQQDALSAGAGHDIEVATKIALKGVAKLGFSNLIFADYEQLPSLRASVEAEAQKWLEQAYNSALTYLKENLPLLKLIAEALYERESMVQQDLDELVKSAEATKAINTVH